MECIEYRDEFENDWSDFVESSPDASLGHDIAWRNVFSEALGHRTKYLLALDGDSIAGVLPLADLRHTLLGNRLISLPVLDRAGILSKDQTARTVLVEALDRMVKDGPYRYAQIRRPMNGETSVSSGKVTLMLDISKSADSIWTSLDPKVRNQVRKAEKSGLTAYIGGIELVPDFYRVYAHNMRDLGVPALPIQLFNRALIEFGARARVVIIRHSSEPVGGGIMIVFKGTASVPWASSSRHYFRMCPNNLLYWTVIRLATETGCKTFDFGRSTIDSGPFHFKRQWGAEVLPLSWDYVMSNGFSKPDFTTSNPQYQLIVRVWRRLPVSIANRLGPMISSQVA